MATVGNLLGWSTLLHSLGTCSTKPPSVALEPLSALRAAPAAACPSYMLSAIEPATFELMGPTYSVAGINVNTVISFEGTGVSVGNKVKWITGANCAAQPVGGSQEVQTVFKKPGLVTATFRFTSAVSGQPMLCYKFNNGHYRNYPNMRLDLKQAIATLMEPPDEYTAAVNVLTELQFEGMIPTGSSLKFVKQGSSTDCSANPAGGSSQVSISAGTVTRSTFKFSKEGSYFLCAYMSGSWWAYPRTQVHVANVVKAPSRPHMLENTVLADPSRPDKQYSAATKITWTSNSGMGGCFFEVHGEHAGTGLWIVMWEGQSTTAELTGLTGGTIYAFKVREECESSDDWSAFSEPLAISTKTTVPLQLKIPYKAPNSMISSTEMTIQWDPPSNDGGAEVTEYQLFQSTKKDYTSTHRIIVDDRFKEIYLGPRNKFMVNGLVPNTFYHYAVRATNANGDSGFSDVLTLSTKKSEIAKMLAAKGAMNMLTDQEANATTYHI